MTRRCIVCFAALPTGSRCDRITCSTTCRVRAHRRRQAPNAWLHVGRQAAV
jgi:predicted nucleic acid-binding Zn ribbon protein